MRQKGTLSLNDVPPKVTLKNSQLKERFDAIKNWTCEQLEALNISIPLKSHTVAKRMRNAGFVYSQYKKSYAVYTHERSDVIEARRQYVFSYLADEINQAVWIQLPIEEARK